MPSSKLVVKKVYTYSEPVPHDLSIGELKPYLQYKTTPSTKF